MHPIAVEFDFVQPAQPFRRPVDEFGELWFDPARERRRLGAPVSGERPCHVVAKPPARGRHRIIMAS
jgi:hypothetical protein